MIVDAAQPLVDGNLAATLAALAADRAWLDRPLLHVGDAAVGTTSTFRDVVGAAARVASLLTELGVRPGDRVLLAAADSVGFATTFLGALRIGAVAVLVNPGLTGPEHAALDADAEPTVVVADTAVAARFSGARVVVATEELTQRTDGLAEAPHQPLEDGAPAYVQYTSGTTGRPKGAIHRHGDPLTYFEAVAKGVYRLTPDDVIFCVSKMFFAYGLPTSLLHPMLGGASAVLEPGRPTPDVVRARCAHFGVSILLSVPTLFATLVDAGGADDYATVRLAISVASPCGHGCGPTSSRSSAVPC